MIVYLNGKFVPEGEALVSAFDRGFLYGDGLFESIRFTRAKPFRWADHAERFASGAKLLLITPPCSTAELLAICLTLIEKNGLQEGILRIALSRGVGNRGYSPRGASNPSLFISLHPPAAAMESCRLATSTLRLPPGDVLSTAKTSNKLLQILARAGADDAGADDALLLNTEGHVAETSSGNIFWIQGGRLFTPPLQCGIIPGITRKVVLEIALSRGIVAQEKLAGLDELKSADGVFATLSSRGIVEACHLDDAVLSRSEMTRVFQAEYARFLEANL